MKFLTYLFFLCISNFCAMAQYGSAYHKADQQKLQQMRNEREADARKSASYNSNKSSSSSSKSGSVNNAGAELYEQWRRNSGKSTSSNNTNQTKTLSYNEKLQADWAKKEARFDELSKNVAKTPANYNKLISLAEQAGIENYIANRMLGYINVTEKRTIRSDESGYTYTAS
jgi:hypothetical protein